MADLKEQIKDLDSKLDDELLDVSADASQPMPIREAARDLFKKRNDEKLFQVYEHFTAASFGFLGAMSDVAAITTKLVGAGSPGLTKVLADMENLFSQYHFERKMQPALNAGDPPPLPPEDENDEPPPATPDPIPATTASAVLTAPKPLNSTEYFRLADEYVRFFQGADYSAKKKDVGGYGDIAITHRSKYEAIGTPLGIPWWFIAGCHLLESGLNFATHLHNGDSLARRTVHDPAGQPEADGTGANGSYTFEESAVDALKAKKLHLQTDWSLARVLYRWESYNGWGYRPRSVPSPYLWSYSSIYRSGKYIKDHVFSATAVSDQCGAAVFLKYLADKGQVDLKVDNLSEPEAAFAPAFAAAGAGVGAGGKPTVDGPIPAGNTFAVFVHAHLPKLRHFEPNEFLIKGGQDAAIHLNTDPPEDLWPNVLGVIAVLDEFRERIGHSVVLNSVYRSEAYNKAVGGVSGSQHKKFQATDFHVPDFGTPQSWATTLAQMRTEGLFSGGIGVYGTFVHVDTRGWDANWTG